MNLFGVFISTFWVVTGGVFVIIVLILAFVSIQHRKMNPNIQPKNEKIEGEK